MTAARISGTVGGPAISVGMPVYNGERYVAETLDCVLAQTFDDFELLISDNASTDRTEEICRDYAARDSRIRYIRRVENIGAAGNYNELVHLARAEFFRWHNADDLCVPEAHRLCYQALLDNPDAVVAYGKSRIIDGAGQFVRDHEDGHDIRQERASDRFRHYYENAGLTNAIYGLMRRQLLLNTVLMGDGSYPAADINLMAHLTLQGKFVEVPHRLFDRRMHEQASSWNRADDEVQQSFWNAQRQRFTLPTWRQGAVDAKAVVRAPIGVTDKARALAYLARRMLWQRNELAGDLVFVVRSWFKAA